MISQVGLKLFQLLGFLPLPVLRAIGLLLGIALYLGARWRRHVVLQNLRVCFPQKSEAQRLAIAKQAFVYFAQAWLDRSWLWHRSPSCIQARVLFTGAVDELTADVPTVIFAPHFVGLDVGWTLLTLSVPKHFTTIFTPQSNPVAGAWMTQGRSRFGQVELFQREDGVKTIVSSLRNNAWLYLLPDMNFGPEESIFVPFFGEPAATVPSLSRFAKLGRARVLPVVTRMTSSGYEVEVLKAWNDFPTDDAQADTVLMNQHLETYIQEMPAQYFWVHKRFKTRPEGADPIY
jgi:Kdo2-lipid IVA lauroyltransferase/acyltransferase